MNNKLQSFIREWNGFNRAEKGQVIKNEVIIHFKNESTELTNIIKNSIELFKNKNRGLETNLKEIQKKFSYTEKYTQIEQLLFDIGSQVKGSYSLINRLNFEDIAEEKYVPDKAFNNSNQFNHMTFRVNDSTKSKFFFDYLKVIKQPEIILSSEIERKGNNFDNSFQLLKTPSSEPVYGNNPDYPKLEEMTFDKGTAVVTASNYYTENQVVYSFLIAAKPKSDELLIFTQTLEVKSVRVQKRFFVDQNNTFTLFPENSKYVNIGKHLLLTGGYLNKVLSTNCYIISVIDSNYNISISNFPKMLEGRERHNILFLPKSNNVIVCSGFFNRNAEIISVANSTNWEHLPSMNEIRANATMALVDHKFVFCLGGFNINAGVGYYHNSVEFIDLASISRGWNCVSFEDFDVNVQLSAMGVISIASNAILLCGGYDGKSYRSEVLKLELTKGKDENINLACTHTNISLPGNFIFLHNAFVRLNDETYNFDLGCNFISFNSKKNLFKVFK